MSVAESFTELSNSSSAKTPQALARESADGQPHVTPWAREIKFALNLGSGVPHGTGERDDLRQELALKLLYVEQFVHPELLLSKYGTEGRLDRFAIEVCKNFLFDWNRKKTALRVDPLDKSEPFKTHVDVDGYETAVEIMDADSAAIPDSDVNIGIDQNRLMDSPVVRRALATLDDKYQRAILGPPDPALSPSAVYQRRSRARSLLADAIKRGRSSGPFYSINPLVELWHEMVMDERGSGRNFAPVDPQVSPPRCNHGVMLCVPCHVCRYADPSVEIQTDKARDLPINAESDNEINVEAKYICCNPVRNRGRNSFISVGGDESPEYFLAGRN
jgi:hypothetical protein